MKTHSLDMKKQLQNQKDSDRNATTSVEMPEILIGTNSTQDVQQDMILLGIMEGMKNE
jgi:hypothetical protein